MSSLAFHGEWCEWLCKTKRRLHNVGSSYQLNVRTPHIVRYLHTQLPLTSLSWSSQHHGGKGRKWISYYTPTSLRLWMTAFCVKRALHRTQICVSAWTLKTFVGSSPSLCLYSVALTIRWKGVWDETQVSQLVKALARACHSMQGLYSWMSFIPIWNPRVDMNPFINGNEENSHHPLYHVGLLH